MEFPAGCEASSASSKSGSDSSNASSPSSNSNWGTVFDIGSFRKIAGTDFVDALYFQGWGGG